MRDGKDCKKKRKIMRMYEKAIKRLKGEIVWANEREWGDIRANNGKRRNMKD